MATDLDLIEVVPVIAKLSDLVDQFDEAAELVVEQWDQSGTLNNEKYIDLIFKTGFVQRVIIIVESRLFHIRQKRNLKRKDDEVEELLNLVYNSRERHASWVKFLEETSTGLVQQGLPASELQETFENGARVAMGTFPSYWRVSQNIFYQ